MHCVAAFFCLLVIVISRSKCFFQNPPLELSTLHNRLNLTCATDFGEVDVFTGCEYCVYEFFTNGTDSTVWHDCIYLTNSYRLVAKRCSGFTNTSDIGYGLCSKLPFEYFEIDLLCICATDLCNENFTTCKQSVDANPTIPPLPSLVPVLTAQSSAISCEDTPLSAYNSTYYCVRDSTPYIDMNQCEEYVQNHTVLCMYLESDNGSYLTVVALPDEDYEYVLVEQIQTMQGMAMQSTVQQYSNETLGAFYVQWTEILDNSTHTSNRCYCRTNNCNINLTACLQSSIPANNSVFIFQASTISMFVGMIMALSISSTTLNTNC